MDAVRLGVIGAGSWVVSNHLPAIASRDDVELVSAVRKGPDALAELRQRFGFTHTSEDYREALEQDLDAVIVASPAALHHEHAAAALAAGCHVLCEKPFTLDPAEAWDLVDLAHTHDRHLLLSFGWNYRPLGIRAKSLMDQHGVGNVEHVMVAMASGTRELLSATGAYKGSATDFAPDPDTWTNPAMSGGGYAPAQLSHAMGLALWLTGDRVAEVWATTNNLDARVDLHAAAVVRYASGATGAISGASCPSAANAIDASDEPWPRHQLQVRVYGSEGQLIVDAERDFCWLYREDGFDQKADLPDHAGLYQCDAPPNVLVDLALGRDVPNRSPGALGAKTVELVDALERSAWRGDKVIVQQSRSARATA